MIAALTLCVALFSVNWTVLNGTEALIYEGLLQSPDVMVLVIHAYSVALLGVLIPVKGRLSVLLYGLTAFGLASAAGAMSVNGGMLIACRFGQGLAAAIVLRAGFELTRTHFRGTTWWPALVAPLVVSFLAQIAGPALGAIIAEEIGSRWILLVEIPLTAIAVTAVALCPPRARPAMSHP